MIKRTPQSIDEYIAAEPREVQVALERVRDAIHKAVPKAEETISYKIPAFKLDGRILLYFAGWEKHYALYPAGSAKVREAFKDELARYEVRKGTIRFPLSQPVPVTLIRRIAKFRAKEISASAVAPKSRVQARHG